ncbi:pilus assembly protein [Algibacillus agarilyticus]|uniref:pilus assembly protein n=1 Tax=Algibacillus agarilyticus TaxID=2234133 RepID=UPI001300A15F|nr:PilC/PilY family type IV pilus protein [Algibacillus agarilyticus]
MKTKLLCFIFAFALPFSTLSEDIELYVNQNAESDGNNPQIMIIFDNSGSMSSPAYSRPTYDPSVVYPMAANNLTYRATYFAKGSRVNSSSIPEVEDENEVGDVRRFERTNNACNSSREPLYGLWRKKDAEGEPDATNPIEYGDDIQNRGDSLSDYELISGGEGTYLDRIIEYKNREWVELRDNNGLNANDVIDCYADTPRWVRRRHGHDYYEPGDDQNQATIKQGSNFYEFPDGFPVDNQKSGNQAIYHLDDSDSDYEDNKADFDGIEYTTLYTVNYLNWYHSKADYDNRSRLAVAKESITNLINASSNSVDYGLTFFNYNTNDSNNGGRIVNALNDYPIDVVSIKQNVANVTASTYTPLAESLYEVYRYFSGQSVLYGYNAGSLTPARDTSAESPLGTYESPVLGTNCRDQIYVVIITDGEPYYDVAADDAIQALISGDSELEANGIVNDSYLPALAGYMAKNDLNNDLSDGKQTAITYTIGFGDDAINDAGDILNQTAVLGGGHYYEAADATQLTNALQNAIVSILQTSSSFTSPAIAANNFDRTHSLDSVYFSMFLPEQGPKWRGNIKKLKVINSKIVDSAGNNAINTFGNIEDTAKSFWGGTSNCSGATSCSDGNDVEDGGVAEALAKAEVSSRKLLSDIDSGGGLATFNYDNVSSFDFGEPVIDVMNVLLTEVEDNVKWAMGYDIDDYDRDLNVTEMREDVFGDPLHSKPVVINYGGLTESTQDLRIVVGTNAGALHMFKDSSNATSVSESWAFYPRKFFPNIQNLRFDTSGKVYGIDGSPVVYTNDKDNDGIIEQSAGEKAIVIFGLRRGGRDYYALDISDPDDPKLLWHIKGGSGDFAELGQSWSKPVVGYINHKSHTNGDPVIFFSGGYNGDSDTGSSSTNPGRGVFIVDVLTGGLIWKATSSAYSSGSKNTYANFKHAIPGRIAILDSDGNGLIDRLYSADIGGHVWRIDLASSDPFSSTKPWTVQELASLGGSGLSARKFFAEPVIVRTVFSEVKELLLDYGTKTETVTSKREVPYDGILLGSGDRANPNDKAVNDMMFMIQDRDIVTRSFVAPSDYEPITVDNLYDFSNDPFSNQTSATFEANQISLGSSLGWKYDFSSSGEKVMSPSRALGGIAYFTSFLPGAKSADVSACELVAGTGNLYALDFHYGTRVYNWESISLGERIPDTPVLFAGDNADGSSNLTLIGVGSGENTTGTIDLKEVKADPDTCETGETCEATKVADYNALEVKRTYIAIKEESQ